MESIFNRQQFQYIAALVVTKQAGGVLTSVAAIELFTAHNDDEAYGVANRLAHSRFSVDYGYRDHYVVVVKTEVLTYHIVKRNECRSCYTRCICGALLHYHEGTVDTRKTKPETAVYNLQYEGYTKEEIIRVAEMYFPGEP